LHIGLILFIVYLAFFPLYYKNYFK